MGLVKSPTLSPAKLAANRANARKSTGPRTPRGKARVALNSLRSGRRARAFSKRLGRTGSRDERKLLYAILEPLFECFNPQTLCQQRRVERLACEIWCALKGKGLRGENNRKPSGVAGPASGTDAAPAVYADTGPAVPGALPLDPFPGRARFRIEDRRRRLRLTFWTQRVGPQALRPVDPMKIFWAPMRRPLRVFGGVSRWVPARGTSPPERPQGIDEQTHDVS